MDKESERSARLLASCGRARPGGASHQSYGQVRPRLEIWGVGGGGAEAALPEALDCFVRLLRGWPSQRGGGRGCTCFMMYLIEFLRWRQR